MKGIRLRFVFWVLGLVALYLLANLKLRVFPHVLIIFWILLPILSIIFSYASRKKLKLRIEVDPLYINRDEPGTWLCTLRNESRHMSFFLQFPKLKFLEGRKKPKPFEIMLQPGEERHLRLFFQADYSGHYSLDAEEPIYEDLLGFFWLGFSRDFNRISSDLFCLPRLKDEIFNDRQARLLDEYRQPQDQKSLNAVTDDVFSIEPLRQGQSLAHAHWKLSARLQEWMIKHYSDNELQPLRIVLDLKDIDWEGKVRFQELENEPLSEDLIRMLNNRNRILDSVYSYMNILLSLKTGVELCDRTGSSPVSYYGPEEIEAVGQKLSALAFKEEKSAWGLDLSPDRKQLIFIQEIEEDTLGSLIRYKEYGLQFLVISLRSGLSDHIEKQLRDNLVSCLWIDADEETV